MSTRQGEHEMKALQWIKFLEAQRTQHGKVLFRVAELANVAQRPSHALNVELARLVVNGILARYAHGVYGIPGTAEPEQLVPMLDPGAYITGMFAMYRHNLVTQVPAEITCFTNRRHNLSRLRRTSFGKLTFICVSHRIYVKPAGGVLAPPEQAFCDFVHIAKRQGLDPASLVTFNVTNKLNLKLLARIAKHYPEPAAEILRKQCQALK